jgi:hypothetical protein
VKAFLIVFLACGFIELILGLLCLAMGHIPQRTKATVLFDTFILVLMIIWAAVVLAINL